MNDKRKDESQQKNSSVETNGSMASRQQAAPMSPTHTSDQPKSSTEHSSFHRQLKETYLLSLFENLLRLGERIRLGVGDGAVESGRSAARKGRRKGRDSTRGKGKGKSKLHGGQGGLCICRSNEQERKRR